jgi:hypothetical protein
MMHIQADVLCLLVVTALCNLAQDSVIDWIWLPDTGTRYATWPTKYVIDHRD